MSDNHVKMFIAFGPTADVMAWVSHALTGHHWTWIEREQLAYLLEKETGE